MGNRLDKAIHDSRNHLRVKENKSILLRGKDEEGVAHGRIQNISLTGMMLEVDNDVTLEAHKILSFDFPSETNNSIPDAGKVVWQRKKNFLSNKVLCGVEFLDVNESEKTYLKSRIQAGVKKLKVQRGWVGLLKMILVIGIVGVIGYMAGYSFQVYQNMNISIQQLLHVTHNQAIIIQRYKRRQKDMTDKVKGMTQELIQVRQGLAQTQKLYSAEQSLLQKTLQDLDLAKKALKQSEMMLAQARADGELLKGNNKKLTALYGKEMAEVKADMNNTIALLQERNKNLSQEVKNLQGKLAYYAGGVKSIDQGKDLLKLYKRRMKLVKSKIRMFKKEVRKVKKIALRNRDKVRSLLGNNGYLIKNGKVVKVDEKKYRLAETESVIKSKKLQIKPQVAIDVQFFK